MNREDIYTKEELLKRMQRYCRDPKRYFPTKLFAQEVATEHTRFLHIFKYQMFALTNHLQIRASRVLKKMENGDYRLMQNANGKQWLEHRETPRARLKPVAQLVFTPTGIGLKLGLRNKSDYGDQEGLFHDPA